MSMSINSATSSNLYASNTRQPKAPELQAFRQLSQDLKSGDLDDAKKAYAAIVKNAPPGASWNANSNFAQLGKALQSGDMSAAQSAFAAMKASHTKPPVGMPLPPATPIDSTGTSSTDSAVGSSVNLTA